MLHRTPLAPARAGCCFTLAFAIIALLHSTTLVAQSSNDLRDLDTHCPFVPPDTLEDWQARAADLKLQLQVSLGLYPPTQLDPVQPQIYGRVDCDGYSIEKVTFESLPGLFVTGNLYRPAELAAGARVPAVLSPHGHWDNARFYEAKPAEVKSLLASGAERFENAARNHIQARCVQLARMGCIVFHWDMLGYCDSQQINFDRAHRFASQPPQAEVTDKGWLLYSPLAEAHSQSILGLQTLATQRAVDMLLTLPEVDASRIAIAGASGGGTQSFLGAALDDRISLAFPAVMVSTGMQGGCTCENACLLRTGTGNVEMASLIAPRPLGLTAADDWTRTMPTDGFPELKKLYGLFDAQGKVALFPAVHFGHNFNHVSRVALYGWVNQHFGLGFEQPVLERDFQVTLRDQLSVWDSEHPQPPGGEDFERSLLQLWATIIDGQLQGWLQGDAQQLQQLAKTLTQGWRAALGLTTHQLAPARAESELQGTKFVNGQLPAWNILSVVPEGSPKTAGTSVADAAADAKASHEPIMEKWIPSASDLHIEVTGGNGTSNHYLRLAGQTDAGERIRLQALVENPRLAAAYTFGYNLPLFATRAQQIGLTLRWLSSQDPAAKLTLRGQGADAALAAAGVFVAQELARTSGAAALSLQLELAPGEFAFAKVTSIRSPEFLPAAARFWDLPGLVACSGAQVKLSGDAETLARYQQLQPLAQELGGKIE